jgi:hypothetical protein
VRSVLARLSRPRTNDAECSRGERCDPASTKGVRCGGGGRPGRTTHLRRGVCKVSLIIRKKIGERMPDVIRFVREIERAREYGCIYRGAGIARIACNVV